MFYQEYAPPQPLQPFVRTLWCLECDDSAPISDFVLPDGFTELIVHYGLIPNSERVLDSSEDTVFAGQIRSALSLEFPNGLGMMGVRFRPAGASCLFRESLHSTADSILSLQSWNPRLKSQLEETIWSAASRTQRVSAVWQFLENTVDFDGYDRQVAQLVAHFNHTRGKGEVSALMDRFNIGQRQVERRFKATVGLSMKEYNRIVRFKEAIRRLHEGSGRSLLDVALECGYYDQAHFNREFKSLSGKSPRQYLQNKSDIENLYLESEDPLSHVENLQYEPAVRSLH